MKKIIICLFVIVVFMLSFTKENVIIPKESIRYRIVANSNNEIDQYNKLKANEIIFPIINNFIYFRILSTKRIKRKKSSFS